MAVSIGELMASVKLDTSAFEKSLNGLQKSVAGIGNVLKGGALTAMSGSLSSSIWKAGSSFASQMSMVKAVSGATGREFKQLEEAAIRMGSTTKFTATQAGEALQYMGMAGWEVEEMLEGLPSVMALAAASGEDLGTVSDIVTDAMTALGLQAGYMVGEVDRTTRALDSNGITHYFDAMGNEIKEPIDQTQHFADVLAQAAMSSNTNIKKMGETFKYAAPLAGALGYSAEDTALAIGLMANAGIKSSQAGTSLRMMFTQLANPSKDVQAALDRLGVSMTDSAGNMRPLRDVLRDMKSGFETLVPAEKTAVAETLAGKRAMSGLLAIVNSGDEFDRLAEKIDNCNGAAGRMETTAIDNAAGSWTILKSAVEGANISLFKLSEQDLTSLIKTATELVDWFNKADDSFKKGVRNLILMGSSVGPLVLGASALQMLGPAILGLVSPIGMIGTAMALLGVSASGVGDAFVRGLGRAVQEGNLLVQGRVKRLNSMLANATKNMKSMMNVKGVFGNMKSMTAKTIKDVSGLVTSIIKTLAEMLPYAQELFTDLFDFFGMAIAQHLPEIMDAMADIVTGIVDVFTNGKFLDAIETVGKSIMEAFTKIDPATGQNAFQKILSKLLKPLQDPTQIKNTITRMAQMIIGFITGTDWKGAWKTLTDELGKVDWADLVKTVLDAFQGIGKAIADTILDGLAWSETDFESLSKTLLDALSAAGDGIGEAIKKHVGDVNWAQVGADIHNSIEGAVEFAQNWLSGRLIGDANKGNIWSGLGAMVSRMIKSGIDIASDFLSGLILGKNGEGGGTDWAKEGATIAEGIKTGIESILNTGTGLLVGLLTGDATEAGTWTENVGKILGALRQAFSSAGTSISEFLFGRTNESGVKEFEGFIDSMVKSFSRGIEEMSGEGNPLKGVLDSILDSLVKLPIEAAEFGVQMATKLINAITDNINLENLGSVIGGLAEQIGTSLGEAFESLGRTTATALSDIGGAFEGGKGEEAINGATALGKGIVTAIANAISGYAQGASMIWDAIASILTAAHEGNVAGAIAQSALEIAKTFIETLTANFSVSAMAASFGNLVNALGSAIGDTLRGIGDVLSGAVSMATDDIENGVADTGADIFSTIGTNFVEALVSAIKGALDAGAKISEAIAGLMESACRTDLGSKLGAAASQVIAALIEELKKAISGNQIEEIFSNVGSSLGGFAETAGDFASSLAQYFVSNLPEIFNAGIEIAGQLMAGIVKGIAGLGNGIIHALMSVFKGAFRGIAQLFGLEFDDSMDMARKATFNVNGREVRGDALETEFMVDSQTRDAEKFAAALIALREVAGEDSEYLKNMESQISATDVAVTRAAKDTDKYSEAQRAFMLAALDPAQMNAMFRGLEEGITDENGFKSAIYADMQAMMLGAISNGTVDTAQIQSIFDKYGMAYSQESLTAFTQAYNQGLESGNFDAGAILNLFGIEVPKTIEEAMSGSNLTISTGMTYDTNELDGIEAEIARGAEGLKKTTEQAAAEAQTATGKLVDAISMEEVAEAFDSTDDLYDWIQLMNANGKSLGEVFSSMGQWLSGQDGLDVASYAQSFANDFSSDIWGDDELAARIREFFTQYATAITEGAAEVEDAKQELATADSTTASPTQVPETADLNLTKQVIADLVTHVNTGGETLDLHTAFQTEMDAIYGAVSEKADAIEARLDQMTKKANNLMTGVTFGSGAEGLEGGEETDGEGSFEVTSSGMGALLAQISAGMSQAESMMRSGGEAAGGAFVEGIKSGMSEIGGAFAGIASKAVSQAKAALSYSKGYEIGSSFLKGISDAIKKGCSFVAEVKVEVGGEGEEDPPTAFGGIFDGAQRRIIAEDGPEAVIPLSGKRRNRGLSLWMKAGEMLGAIPSRQAASTVENIGSHARIGEVSRGTVRTDTENIRSVARQTAVQMAQIDRLDPVAVGNTLAERLIASGALRGDVYLSNKKVGRMQSPVISDRIASDLSSTIAGKAALGVVG